MEISNWTVSEIWTYPIKSCKGTQHQQARVGISGLEGDREYMVVDAETGMFVAQRGDSGKGIGIKSMCQIEPRIQEDDLMMLSAPGMSPCGFEQLNWLDVLGVRDGEYSFREVQIWTTKLEAVILPDFVNNWFTEFLSRERPGKYQLVWLHSETIRRAKVGYSQLRFADGYPFLVISQESLDDLNTRIGGVPLLMNRFRPNIVIKGGQPYDEDRLDRMVIAGGVELEGKELCIRCPITTTDQDTAERGKEPLKTLATYRRNPIKEKGGVVFGRNYNHLSIGEIKVEGTVQALQYNTHSS